MDREELAQFIDRLVKQKPLNAADPAEAEQQRERLISNLDQSIRLSILNKMNEEQLHQFNSLLDRDDDGAEDAFAKFFQDAGIDLPQTVSNTATRFAQVYLGGIHG